MGQGSPKTQTVKNVTELDPATKAWQSTLSGMGANLYAQGPMQYYGGNTVAQYSPQSQQALNMMQGQAQAGAPNYGAAQMSAQRNLTGYNPAMPGASMFAMGGSAPQQQLDQFGMGSVNPYIDQAFNNGSRHVADAVNAQFAKAGRFGANAAYGQGMGNAMGDLYTSIAMPAYESSANRALSATGTNLQSQMQGLGMYGDMFQQGAQNSMNQQQLLSSLYNYGSMPAQQMAQVGSAYDSQNQANIDADKARWDFNQMAPWQNANMYAGLMSGMPGATSSTQTQTMPGTNRLMSAMGGAASAFGASGGNPWAAGIGGLAGLFGGG